MGIVTQELYETKKYEKKWNAYTVEKELICQKNVTKKENENKMSQKALKNREEKLRLKKVTKKHKEHIKRQKRQQKSARRRQKMR